MTFENMGDWCKWLEKNFSPEVMIPTLPVIIRLDGVSFHTWTKGLDRPFDNNLNQLMISATKFLVKETNAIVGYTQSDEITLILYSSDRKKDIYNSGKKQKILSKLTGKFTPFFNTERVKYLPNHNRVANFDCRIYQTPSLHDAIVQLLWRENDAVKNSIQMLAQSLFPNDSLKNLNGSQCQDRMMLEKGVNWNDLPTNFKRGTYIKRIKSAIKFNADDVNTLPPKHKARLNPDLLIERSVIKPIVYPPFNSIDNPVDVIFFDKEPVIRTS